MNDDDLDRLLTDARKDATAPSGALAQLIAAETVEQRTKKSKLSRRWLRRGMLVPVGVGAVALSAATTYGAYQLSIPPFVATEPGVERASEPISVDYTTDKGTMLDCDLYVEFSGITQAQRDALNAMSSNPRWDGFGQRIYDRLPDTNRKTQNGPEPLWSERVTKVVYAEALEEIPGLTMRSTDDTAGITGATTRCEYPEGQR